MNKNLIRGAIVTKFRNRDRPHQPESVGLAKAPDNSLIAAWTEDHRRRRFDGAPPRRGRYLPGRSLPRLQAAVPPAGAPAIATLADGKLCHRLER